jgi:hypothetical protein
MFVVRQNDQAADQAPRERTKGPPSQPAQDTIGTPLNVNVNVKSVLSHVNVNVNESI